MEDGWGYGASPVLRGTIRIKRIIKDGSTGGFGGTMFRASRLSKFLVLGTSAWRQFNTAKISESKGKGWRFFEWFSQKIRPGPCLEKSLLRDIERDK